MDIDSPDGAKKFPGLFGAELHSGSDSDSRVGRQLIGGKKKDKKEKDISYAALGDSSGDDEEGNRSPLKSRRGHLFKFSKREKRDKSRTDEKRESKSKITKEKESKTKDAEERVAEENSPGKIGGDVVNLACTDVVDGGEEGDACKEKTTSKDKESKCKEEKNKDKSKDGKSKKKKSREEKKEKLSKKDSKTRERKKPLAPVSSVNLEEECVFGVELDVAVCRSRCHDSLPLPAVVRQCIDFIEEYGLTCEGIYRLSGVKSKVQQLKRAYNAGEVDFLTPDHEPHTVACLLKLFLRELPEPVLTGRMSSLFETAAALKEPQMRVQHLAELLAQLPASNRLLLQYVFKHMQHVIEQEKQNKMSVQNVSLVLSPTMQISHRVLNAFFMYGKILFSGVTIKKYVPPLALVGAASEWPDDADEIRQEIAKHESLLNYLHWRLETTGSGPTAAATASASVSAARKVDRKREEQLWEAQRVLTQLKRKHRLIVKNADLNETTGVASANTALSSSASVTPNAATSSTCTAAAEEPVSEQLPSPSSDVDTQQHQDLKQQQQQQDEQKTTVVGTSGVLKSVQMIDEHNVTVIEISDSTADNNTASHSQEKEGMVVEREAGDAKLTATLAAAAVVRGGTGQLSFSDLHRRHNVTTNTATNSVVLCDSTISHYTDDSRPARRRCHSNDDSAKRASADSLEQLLREAVVLKLEEYELLATGRELRNRLAAERTEIGRVRETVREMETLYKYRTYSTDSSDLSSADESGGGVGSDGSCEGGIFAQLLDIVTHNEQMQESNNHLQDAIHRERRKCQRLRAQIRYLQLTQHTASAAS